MRIRNSKDFYAGLFFMLAGGGFVWGATEYQIGSASQMGPGYFPVLLGVLLALVGLGILIQSLTGESDGGDLIGSIAWKPMFYIVLANMAFGVLVGGLPGIGLPYLGLVCAIIVTTVIASLASDKFRAKGVLVLAIVLAASSYAIFVWMLKLRIPAWPAGLA